MTSLGETPCERATSLRLTQQRRAGLVTPSHAGARALARDG